MKVLCMAAVALVLVTACEEAVPRMVPSQPEQTPPEQSTPEPEYHIDIVYGTPVPENIRSGLARAVEYWQKAITSDAGPPITATGGAGDCALPPDYVSHETDDLLILVSMEDFNVGMGRAGVCARRANGMAYFGIIQFNSNRLSSAYDVASYGLSRHEIAHLLGFGTSPIWEANVRGGYYYGPKAARAFGGPLPLYDTAHWLSSPGLERDIMSVPIPPNPESLVVLEVTLAALADAGHTVDYTMAGR